MKQNIHSWGYIPNWVNKRMTCTFCGSHLSVKYFAVVKDIDGKKCKVPICGKCLFTNSERKNND